MANTIEFQILMGDPQAKKMLMKLSIVIKGIIIGANDLTNSESIPQFVLLSFRYIPRTLILEKLLIVAKDSCKNPFPACGLGKKAAPFKEAALQWTCSHSRQT
jgi:hypothetical protein